MVGGVLINGLVLAIIVLLATHAVGTSWLRSVDYLAAADPAKLGLPGGLPPGVNFLTALMTHNVILLALLGIGFVDLGPDGHAAVRAAGHPLHAGLGAGPQRPAGPGEVNDRMHTPVTAIVFCTVTGELALLALINIAAGQPAGRAAGPDRRVHPGVRGRHRVPVPAARRSGSRRAAGGSSASRPSRWPAPAGARAGRACWCCSSSNKSISTEFAVTAHLSRGVHAAASIAAGVLWYIGALLLQPAARRQHEPGLQGNPPGVMPMILPSRRE